jgi:hypothetical protein
MRIRLTKGWIYISFHPKDWHDVRGGVRPFVEQLKLRVPRAEREYLGKSKTWKIVDASANRASISDISRQTITRGMIFKHRRVSSFGVMRRSDDNIKVY